MNEMKHSYTLDIYKDRHWESLVKEEEDIRQVDIAFYKLTALPYQVQLRVLKDGNVWHFFNNSDYHYLYWKNVCVKQKGPTFNPEKIYGKKLRKTKNR